MFALVSSPNKKQNCLMSLTHFWKNFVFTIFGYFQMAASVSLKFWFFALFCEVAQPPPTSREAARRRRLCNAQMRQGFWFFYKFVGVEAACSVENKNGDDKFANCSKSSSEKNEGFWRFCAFAFCFPLRFTMFFNGFELGAALGRSFWNRFQTTSAWWHWRMARKTTNSLLNHASDCCKVL